MRYLALSFVLVLSACGKKEAPAVVSQESATYRGGSPCSQSVIEDNNAYVRTCSAMVTMDDARACKRQAEQFVAKYPGLDCRAIRGKDQTPFSITEADVREVIRKLAELGA
jgi:hypothetical protein